MAQWSNTDAAGSSPIWAAAQLGKASTRAVANTLFGNTTADAFITGVTVGSYGVDKVEGSLTPGATAGWNLRTVTGSRVRHECLVAMSSLSSDASDDVPYPDYIITITSQPAGNTANTSASEDAEFTVAGITTPSGGTLVYQWTYANGDSIQAGANVGNTTQATLTVNSAVETANVAFKVEVSVAGGANVVSSNATLTITT